MTAMVSTIKSVVQIVKNLDESSRLYEEGLGLKRVGETSVSAKEIGGLRRIENGVFRVARFAREGEDFGCVDLVENSNATEPIRQKNRAFDYGVMTLNFRTNNIEKALPTLEKFGCEAISEILEYNVGKPMREVMMNAATGERLTILEVGGVNDSLPVFNEAIATVGIVTPKISAAKLFYEQGLGLQTAIAFQASGSPFDSLLGVEKLDKLDFATLTADGNWTGKVEILALETGEQPTNANASLDFSRTGYATITFLTKDLDAAVKSCRKIGAEIVVEPQVFNRPFHAGRRAAIVRSLSGELLEIIEDK